MASNSRLPSARRPAGGRPVSMIEGPMLTALPNFSNVTSEGDTSKKAKRRSLLPQFSRKPSSDERGEVGIKEEDEGGHGSGSGSRPASEETRGSRESLERRRAIDQDRKAMPPPASKLSRPASMIPPRGASQFGRMQTRSHAGDDSKDNDVADVDAEAARAQSLAALTGANTSTGAQSPPKSAMPESGLRRSGSTRLPQSPRVGALAGGTLGGLNGPVIPSRTTSTRRKDGSARGVSSISGSATSATIAEERRPSSKKPRPPSQSEQTLGDTARTSPPRSSMMSRSRPTSQLIHSQMQPPSSRPAFNMFQQHYSPAKSALPKPPIPATKTSKSLSAAEEDVTVTFDVAKQQIELQQLSLLHQASGHCMREYTASAKRKLGKKHTKLRKDYESIRATELVHQRITNLSALDSWCRDTGLVVENLQILSLVYSDLTSLIEEGSRHGDVVSMFELWMNEAEAPQPGTFIQPLPDDWKTAHASLALKLRSIQRNLGVLPPPPARGEEGSGLDVVLKGCKALVDGMVKELEVMAKCEKEMLERERTKIDDEVRGLMLDDVGMQAWVPVWQKVSVA